MYTYTYVHKQIYIFTFQLQCDFCWVRLSDDATWHVNENQHHPKLKIRQTTVIGVNKNNNKK